MKSRGVIVVIAVLAIAGVVWGVMRRGNHGMQPGKGSQSEATRSSAEAAPENESLTKKLALQAARMSSLASVADKKSLLDDMHRMIESSDKAVAVSAIRDMLGAKLDDQTGMGFKIGGGGALTEAPTLRTWLLEELAKLDPAVAAEVAREILNTSDSPDEWALAMRNLARADKSAEARELLEKKMEVLLREEQWQREASVGYLEAFDTAVHLGGTKLLPPLTELVSKKDNQAVAHAAFLTLDRLVINEPAQTLTALNEHPEWMQGREVTRANYFARADVADAVQRQQVEAYLLDAQRSPQELTTFAGVFPNANFMISHNLLTENRTLDGPTLRQRDISSLAVVNEWLNDSRFEKRRSFLETVRSRLNEFTRPATR